jgi:hypothetical protein
MRGRNLSLGCIGKDPMLYYLSPLGYFLIVSPLNYLNEIITNQSKTMKQTINLLILALVFSGCEKVINLPLDTTEQRAIIDAKLDMNTGKCTVLLTKSGDYYEKKDFEKITGAKITINEEGANPITLKELGNGSYSSDSMKITSGKKYTIKLENVLGKSYSATTTAPVRVALRRLGRVRAPNELNSTQTRFYVSATWTDPVAGRNYYWLKTYVNGVYRSQDYVLIDDKFTNGQSMTEQTYNPAIQGSKVKIELHSIDAQSYEYFKQLFEVIDNPDKSFNPKSNFGVDAFGFFSITAYEFRTIDLN